MAKFLEYEVDSLSEKIVDSVYHTENNQNLSTWKIDHFYQGKIMFYTSHTEPASHVCKSTLLFRSIHKIERSAKLYLIFNSLESVLLEHAKIENDEERPLTA